MKKVLMNRYVISILIFSAVIWVLFLQPYNIYFRYSSELSYMLTLSLALIAFLALWHQNSNFKKNIRINKLEELFVLIQKVSLNYERLIPLYIALSDMKDGKDGTCKTLAEYFQKRNESYSKKEMQEVLDDIYRIEFLARAYTSKKCRIKILSFVHILAPLATLVFNGGNYLHEIHWPNGSPSFNQFYNFLDGLKDDLLLKLSFERNITSKEIQKRVTKYTTTEFEIL